ncbi:MAG TPA: bifunctional D-glycero-beta-D-manno-heptose-7-phosphate kinase/D-glycero-beta-D-manno-heptose 1-phosphate adenylyltransferase HldE [Cellvibrio sp.]|nr:bifunctional D-glycero-beta-D-manno-heptose-7-phosphate kinase/D-glycero-beta-D-manno-heptose 1-phosphate adenylyltransferase HldE [Cellvibrio sp.]
MLLTVPQFELAKVCVIGDLMLDRYWQGSSHRISPEAPVPVVKVNATEDRPGGAGNVALNIAALGATAVLSGTIGNDEAGSILSSYIHSAGIKTQLQVATHKPTITKLRVLSRHQQLLRMDFEEQFCAEDSTEIMANAMEIMHHSNVLILSDYAKGTLQDCQKLIALAKQLNITVLVDPKGEDYSHYRGAGILTPNITEFEAVVGRCHSEKDMVSKGMALIESLSLGALLITRGEMGMTLLRPNLPEMHLTARAREVYDVTGAGDTVIAVLAVALATGQSLPEAVALANIAAGIVVGKLGAATVSAAELQYAIRIEQGAERGIVTEEQLLVAVESARINGQRIVFTNGCFDILHAGHVSYLENASRQGDRLIVALNSDASVRRLKGRDRPINPLDKRMAVLAGLKSVDWVVSFDEDTPERLLRNIRPDVLVKGGDYSESQVVGGNIVKATGGSVQVLEFVKDCSTTSIVNRIRQQ